MLVGKESEAINDPSASFTFSIKVRKPILIFAVIYCNP